MDKNQISAIATSFQTEPVLQKEVITQTDSDDLQTRNIIEIDDIGGKVMDTVVNAGELIGEQLRSVIRTDNPTTAKQRVLLLSDSHGCNYGDLFSKELNTTSVVCEVNPNAGTDGIIESLSGKTEGFNEHDWIILVSGSNYIDDCCDSKNIREVINYFAYIMEATKHTNVIISTIPFVCANNWRNWTYRAH